MSIQKPRLIHPWEAERGPLARLALSTQRTYTHLRTRLDDSGRVEDDPVLLNALLWPHTREHSPDDLESELDQLTAAGLVCRYTVGGARYVHQPDWATAQKPSRPVPSQVPPCPLHDRSLDVRVEETLGRVLDGVNDVLADLGSRIEANLDEDKLRSTAARIAEDITFLIAPEQAARIGEKIRGFGRAQRRPGGFGTGDRELIEPWSAAVDPPETPPTDEDPPAR
jgi:hypothetical protein